MSATETFFKSRWAEPPDGVEELDPAQLAPGFGAALPPQPRVIAANVAGEAIANGLAALVAGRQGA